MKRILPISVLFIYLFSISLFAQETIQTTDTLNKSKSVFDLSLEELMNIEIVSASRKAEKVFESPVSSYVITKQDIALSGALSIPEALRLCPGVIVREYAPGSYDISIRGGVDGLPSYQYSPNNTTILTMIDNRPIFNNLQGGTYWANLPISLIDIEKIEIVLGASSSLYGPNAVLGVINIISKKLEKKNGNVLANVQYGSKNSVIANVLTGYKASDKFDIGISANMIQRKRTDIDYYDPLQNKFIANISDYQNPSVSTTTDRFYLDNGNYGINQKAANFFVNFKPNSKIKLMGNVGYNNSNNLTSFDNTETTLSNFKNESFNYYLKGDIYGFNLQLSNVSGKQGGGGNNLLYIYNYSTTDFYLDYNYNITKNLNLKPAFSLQRAYISDEEYTLQTGSIGVFNGKANLNNYSFSLKADYNLKKWRLIAASRLDKYTYPDNYYLSYQFIVNYKPTEKDIFRVVSGRSYQGSFIANALVYFKNSTIDLELFPGYKIPNTTYVSGNTNLKLLQNIMYEVGYKKNFSNILYTDISITRQQFDNFTSPILNTPVLDNPNAPTSATTTVKFDNINLNVVQYSATFSFTASLLSSKLTLKPNITIQKTDVSNYSPNYVVDSNIFANNIKTYKNFDLKSTPTWYGGMLVSYNLNSKFTLATQLYGYTDYNLTTNALTNSQPPGQIISSNSNTNINSKLIVNATIHYKVIKNLSLFLNGRNLLNNNSREGFATDKIGNQFYVGANFEY